MTKPEWYETTTTRYRTPEGTVFISILDKDDGPHILVYAGKTGTPLFTLGAACAATCGMALQQGADMEEIIETLRLSHEKSGNGYDARCLADAIADSLEKYGQAH